VSGSHPFLTYWYFHLPNFVLAALMYTLLGRALLGLMAAPDSSNYIWRFFCRTTDPFIALIAPLTPQAAAPVVIWAVRGCLAVLAAGRPALPLSAARRGAAHDLSHAMDRTLYYIGIAFFGMVNGLFNQTWVLFALIHAQNSLSGPLVRQRRG
jgi:hypothetical protein